MSKLVNPHGGGELRPLLLEGRALAAERERAASLPKLALSSREVGDLIMMGIGGFTPLEGFMTHADWGSVCDGMRMANGLFWPIPITLSQPKDAADSVQEGQDVALHDPERDEILATMRVTEKYAIDKAHECMQVFKTTDSEHPGVRMVMEQGEVNLAGPVKVLSLGGFPEAYGELFMTPAQTRELFRQKGWSRVAAFQTRNPMHRSHEYLVKVAIEVSDGVLIHSLLGKLKPGDVPAEVRAKAIKSLTDNYFVPNTIVQAGYPLDMRYAGPREALLHALFRQNYGCSHLIVGRDHAGVGDYYGPFDAHEIFEQVPKGALETAPLKMDWTFWCEKCEQMASRKTCPHGDEDRLLLSGTKLRKMLSEGAPVPDHFSRNEVLAILREHYEGLSDDQKVKVELKGHSAQ
ncbi:MAG: sulfate adenylyltransferase [Gammaproteobacteria bacterium]|nr:sulfate adenylyltransferase [Gammaproteobacteria bacterium]NIU05488.1 sulfate adenylyltransferase [Gammaproteobacteria bacterium]NIV52634.1 sulfate adenylyltransferase [Gammaproteobacteria bacterium]NIX86761.1 sulfate adenylyltransferase [Gammaproteobacteria bacterium]